MTHLMRWVLTLYYRNYKDDNEELVIKTLSVMQKDAINSMNYKLQNKYDR